MRTLGLLSCLVLLIAGGVGIWSMQSNDSALQDMSGGPSLLRDRFDQALEELASNDADDSSKQQAREVIGRLSRTDPPFIPANRFLAEELSKSGEFKKDPKKFREILRNLVVVADSGDVPSQMALIQFYIASGQNSLAIKRLRKIVEDRPELYLQLAQALIRAGEPRHAAMSAQLAVEYFEKQLGLPSKRNEDFLGQANAFSILAQHDQAIAVLERGYEQFPVLKEPLAAALIAQSDRLHSVGAVSTKEDDGPAAETEYASSDQSVSEPNLAAEIDHADQAVAKIAEVRARVFGYLKRAIEIDSTNAGAWGRLHELTRTEDRVSEQATGLFDQYRDRASTQGAIELVLSAVAFFDSDIDGAIALLESAVKSSDPESTNHIRAKNNLASYLAQADPPQFDRAIEIADQLVLKNASAIETRGQILALAGREDDAIADLAVVLQRNPSHAGAAETIARILERRGELEKAAAVRARSRQLNRDRAINHGVSSNVDVWAR